MVQRVAGRGTRKLTCKERSFEDDDSDDASPLYRIAGSAWRPGNTCLLCLLSTDSGVTSGRDLSPSVATLEKREAEGCDGKAREKAGLQLVWQKERPVKALQSNLARRVLVSAKVYKRLYPEEIYWPAETRVRSISSRQRWRIMFY